jgi:NhaP-type Na+/H+ or K+/H+ antiporter
MFKRIREAILASTVVLVFTLSVGAQTEDFTYLRRNDSSIWLLITIGVLVLIFFIGLIYLMRRKNDAPK